MRISKDPEVRKQEMIDAAMQLFAEKGYEATTMSDIAKAVGVVPGLCYKYFESKHELYHVAVERYAKECMQPVIEILNSEEDSLELYMEKLVEHFRKTDGNEKYHSFFHKKGNEMFNMQMSIMICEYVLPYMEKFLEKLYQRGMIKEGNFKALARFGIYGQLPILNDESLTPKEKTEQICTLINKLI